MSGPREIVVTGAGGFVGSNLCPYLEARGHRVVRLSLRSPGWKDRLPEGAHAVVHLAGLAHDLKRTRREDEYFAVNADLSAELFDRFLDSRISRFVFLSSVKAAADNPGSRVVEEAQEPAPATAYGRSKLEAERHMLSRDPGGKRLYILRPCMIHGPGNKGNLNLLHRLVATGLPYPLAAFRNSRSFLSVENLDFVVGELCERDVPTGVYNVADSGFLSTLEVVQIMNAAAGRNTRAWRVPPGLVRALAGIAGRCGLIFAEEKLYKLTENYMVDNRKLLAALGRELPVPVREGLAKTILSFSK